MKYNIIYVIFRLHGLQTAFRNFLKNVKTLDLKTYITILSIPWTISRRNIKGSIFPTLGSHSRGERVALNARGCTRKFTRLIDKDRYHLQSSCVSFVFIFARDPRVFGSLLPPLFYKPLKACNTLFAFSGFSVCTRVLKDVFHRARNMGIIILLYWLRVPSRGSTSVCSFASIFDFHCLFEALKSLF